MIRFAPVFATVATSLCLAACANTTGQYPSLAKRDAERVTGSAQTVAPPPTVPAAPALGSAPVAKVQAELSELIATANRAHRAFLAQQGPTERAISAARGSARGSTNWISAQIALSQLQAARSNAMIALTDMDQLFASERVAHPGALSPAAQTIGAARAKIEPLVTQQDRVLDALLRRLGT